MASENRYLPYYKHSQALSHTFCKFSLLTFPLLSREKKFIEKKAKMREIIHIQGG